MVARSVIYPKNNNGTLQDHSYKTQTLIYIRSKALQLKLIVIEMPHDISMPYLYINKSEQPADKLS